MGTLGTLGSVFRIRPLNNIQPFTYRDTMSHMQLLEQLRAYIDKLTPELNSLLEGIIQEFNESLDAQDTDFDTRFAAFVETMNGIVDGINNRVGNEPMQRVTLTATTELVIDPVWPSAHPIYFQVKQDNVGGWYLTMPDNVSGQVDIYTLPNSVTEFSLIPNGDGTWHIHQPDSSLPGDFPDATAADLINDPTTDTSAALRRHYAPVIGLVGEGIDPTGTYDSTVAIQAKLDMAGSMATDTRKVQVMLPTGSFKVSKQGMASAYWGYCLTIPANVELVGPGEFIFDIVFSNRASVLLVRGDNVTINGVRFRNITEASPFNVGVAMGDQYDDVLERHRIYRNLNVRNCLFTHNWLSVSVQFDQDVNTSGLDGVRIENCEATNKTTNVTSGAAFNYRCTPMGRIKNADMVDSRTRNGLSAAAFNYYGVFGGAITNVAAMDNAYAAVEIENGCEHITVSDMRVTNCARGLWIDDSQFITATNIVVNNYASTNRDAVSITYGGNPSDQSQLTGAIIVSKVVSRYGKITIASFGTVTGGGFGAISISDVEMYLSSSHPTGLMFSNRTIDLQLTNINIHSVRDRGFTGTINAPGTLYMTNCTTDGVESSSGVELFGNGSTVISGCKFHTVKSWPTSLVAPFGNYIAGALYEENINYFRRLNGNGSPEGNVTAGPGSLYQRSGGGSGTALYVKESGTGNTGWVAK